MSEISASQPGSASAAANQPRRGRTKRWSVPERIKAPLALLAEAHECAAEIQRSVWDFAVEIDELRAHGATATALRWLVSKGYAEHAREAMRDGDAARTFEPASGLRFGPTTCFVLTQAGIAFTRSVLAKTRLDDRRAKSDETGRHSDRHSATKPTWDRVRQELRLGSVVVKQYKVPAVNQQLILTAFEEEGWPVRIDDPLPPHPEQDPKRHLHDTIISLNRKRRRPLIRFLGDGSGQGVRWELPPPPEIGNRGEE